MTAAGQVRYSFPAWKGYIFGVDVTQDMNAENANFNDARAPNTCQIMLASELDRYVITPEDIAALYGDLTSEALLFSPADLLTASERKDEDKLAKLDKRIEQAILDRLEHAITDPVKRAVLKAKFPHRQKVDFTPSISDQMAFEQAISSARQGATSLIKYAALRGEVLRFPFQVGQCIFHTGDAFRVFSRDPFRSKDWYFEFTGVVSDWAETRDPSGLRSVSVTGEDNLRPFKLARFSTNPGLADASVVSDERYDSLFRTWRVDHLGPDNQGKGPTLPEILFGVTFGADHAGTGVQNSVEQTGGQLPAARSFDKFYGVNGSTARGIKDTGVGVFNYDESNVYVFGPKSDVTASYGVGAKAFQDIDSLESWQRVMDHKLPELVEDVMRFVPPALRDDVRTDLNAKTVNGVLPPDVLMKEMGEHPERYPVDFGRLLLLIPGSLGPGTNRDLLLLDLVQGVATTTEFTSRLAFIFNVVQRIEFSFYATPAGDVVCEMPLYSFRPEDFGTYAARYMFDTGDVINANSHFTDERVRTQFVLDYWLVQNWESIGKASQQAYQQPSVVNIEALFPIFGIRPEKTDPWGFINSEEEARYYGLIKLSQLNADAWTQNIEATFHAGLGPNRPCWFEVRDFIATVRSVQNSIKWGMGGSVQQRLGLNYRRGWSGLMTSDGSRKVYEAFGGQMSQPIDYSRFFQLDSNASNTSTKQMAGSVVERREQRALRDQVASRTSRSKLSTAQHYEPYSSDAILLFESAIADWNATHPNDQIPPEWAHDDSLHWILKKESGGFPGRPNYTYGGRATDPASWSSIWNELRSGNRTGSYIPVGGKYLQSSATGLGQLTLPNVDKYYPSGRGGIGVPEEEAIGMLRYIQARYGSPTQAQAQYGRNGEGY